MKNLAAVSATLLSLTAVAITASPAQATYYGCETTYSVSAHFSGEAFGKKVSAVYAHAGVQEVETNDRTQTARYYWNSVTDQKMIQKGDHFFAKFNLSGLRGGGDGSISITNDGPVIQYFVVFEDGSAIDQPEMTLIHVNKSFGGAPTVERQQALDFFSAETDATATSAFEVHAGSGCQS